jgi:hypothetical protein
MRPRLRRTVVRQAERRRLTAGEVGLRIPDLVDPRKALDALGLVHRRHRAGRGEVVPQRRPVELDRLREIGRIIDLGEALAQFRLRRPVASAIDPVAAAV